MQEQDNQTPVIDSNTVNADAPVATESATLDKAEPVVEPVAAEPEIERESMEFDDLTAYQQDNVGNL